MNKKDTYLNVALSVRDIDLIVTALIEKKNRNTALLRSELDTATRLKYQNFVRMNKQLTSYLLGLKKTLIC